MARIDACRLCATHDVPYVRVPIHRKEHAPHPPPVPLRLLFVGIAPPRRGASFWDDTRPDRLRRVLLRLLQEATPDQLDSALAFRDSGYFLISAVQCPSECDGREQLPHAAACTNCRPHLRQAFEILRPQRILALGGVPARSMARTFSFCLPPTVRECQGQVWWVSCAGQWIPCSATYFPGNNRHRQAGAIVEAMRRLLDVSPHPGV